MACKYLQLRLFKTKPILVFTMGKVGSLSIYYSLKYNWRVPVFHIHSLNQAEQNFYDEECFRRGVLPGSRSAISMINQQILKKNRPYKIITLVRNPIERNISAFFEAFEYYLGVKAEKYLGSMSDLEKMFHKLLPHNYVSNWFEDYFFQQTGINMYDFKYDKTQKYQFITTKNTEVLVLDVNLDDSLKEQLVANFIDKKRKRINRINVRELTAEANLYIAFKRNIKFDKNYLSNLLETQYFNHYYSEKSKLDTLKRWQKDTSF